jgi:hypothetical protein
VYETLPAASRRNIVTAPTPVILKKTKDAAVYYTITWSLLRKAERYDIIRAVPAMGGIAELYFQDDYGKLNLFCLMRSWYGGLRSCIRELTDPTLEKDPARKQILDDHPNKIFYRYSMTESLNDMNDILFFFMETTAPGEHQVEHSGRYEQIYVKEIDPQNLTTI